MKLGEGAQRARACAHKGKRRSAKRRRRRKEEEQGGEGWGELGNRAGVRAWPCTRLGKQAWVPRACSSRPDIQARIDVHTRCTRGDAHVTDRENVAVNVAL